MRGSVLVIGAAMLALSVPAVAAPEPSVGDAIKDAQRILDDPRNEQLMKSLMSAMSDSLLAMPVGEVKAAAEGRPATAAEKRLTVRDLARRDDPQFEAKLRDGLTRSGPALKQSMKALSASLPALAKSVEELSRSMERLGANLPDPTYPKR